VIIVSPSAADVVSRALRSAPLRIDLVPQANPTGMLDAILLARQAIEASQPRRVLITWCDQVAILPATAAAVLSAADASPEPDLVLPTCRSEHPYVHLERDRVGRVSKVLHRREGDEMPEFGESDAGVFDLSLRCYREWLPQFAAAPEVGARTAERNFVPFVAWVAQRGTVVTVPCTEPEEAIGINTPDELARIEAHLRARHAQ
jgi:bifunctional N-acetylglucosamine-1-phosphate-uridyltransferase/glucosamine-1-phosphate-acetyltransferase GlmU-like protein